MTKDAALEQLERIRKESTDIRKDIGLLQAELQKRIAHEVELVGFINGWDAATKDAAEDVLDCEPVQ